MTPGRDVQASKPAHEGEGPTTLGLLFEEAIRCLDSTDLPGANAALKKAHAEAALDAAKPTGYAGAGGVQNEERVRGSGVRAWVTY